MYWFLTRTSGSQEVITPSTTPTGAPGKGKKKRRWVVEIDGREIVVNSLEEAKQLVEEAQRKLDLEVLQKQEEGRKPRKRKVKAIARPNSTNLLEKKEIWYEEKAIPLPKYRSSINLGPIIARMEYENKLRQDEEIILLLL